MRTVGEPADLHWDWNSEKNYEFQFERLEKKSTNAKVLY